MADNRTTYHLTAQDDFRCLAGDCPASCCSGWRIPVEDELVKRWSELPDTHDRVFFPSAVHKDQDGLTPTLCMTTANDLRCGLLTPGGLCQAHARYGVHYTPLACQAFPKIQEDTTLIRMESASTACPVIARRIVCADETKPYLRTFGPPTLLDQANDRERERLARSEHFNRLMAAEAFALGVRLYYLADNLSQPLPAMNPASPSPGDSLLPEEERMLRELSNRVEQRSLKPDPSVAGSFWNTLYQLGEMRELWPQSSMKSSALMRELPRLPADRRRYYADVYAEISELRERAQPAWHRQASGRLLHVHLVNAGFPWQPSLDNYAFSFVHGVILFALTSLRLWIAAAAGANLDAETFIECVYRTGRAFGHNTLIPAQIQANPALLNLQRYHATFLDL